MKLVKILLLLVLLFGFFLSPVMAEEHGGKNTTDILPEFVLRPIGILASAFGTGLFLFTSPISALASIPEPHNVFEQTFNVLVITPFRFTFQRPIGEYSLLMDVD